MFVFREEYCPDNSCGISLLICEKLIIVYWRVHLQEYCKVLSEKKVASRSVRSKCRDDWTDKQGEMKFCIFTNK